MKKFITNKMVLFTLGIIALILMWWGVSSLVDKGNMIFPSPKGTFLMIIDLLKMPSSYQAIGNTFLRLIIGFVLSFILAFVLGVIVHDNEHLYSFFNPIITFFKSVPTATIVFLFFALSGIKNAPIYVVMTVTFPILYEAIVNSFKQTAPEVVESAMVDGASNLKILFTIKLPIGFNQILVGLTSSFALAFKVAIMAEILSGITRGGIGALIKGAQNLNPTDLTMMFGYSFIAVFFILVISLFASIIKGKLMKKA